MTNETIDILLVEDDEVFAHVMNRALKQREFTVATAHDAETATTLIAQTEFVYAILDLNLGGHTSLGLIPILKANNPTIKILILTGYASIATAVEAIKLGADNYLAKPADADEIMAALTGEPFGIEGDELALINLEPMSVRRLVWEHIQKVLMENDGNISETARQLKMHRRTLQRKLQKRPVAK
jgi:two-component system response regulator RegA